MKIYIRFVQLNGETLAVFMRTSAARRYDGTQWVRMSYAHMGQHGECYDGMQRRKRATREQYMPLLNELQSIGYTVVVA